MLVDSVSVSGTDAAPSVQVKLPAVKTLVPDSKEDSKEKKKSDYSHMADLASGVQNNLNSIHNVNLQFSVHAASGEVVVVVSDDVTGEIIRAIPSMEMLQLAAKLDELVGLMFDQNA